MLNDQGGWVEDCQWHDTYSITTAWVGGGLSVSGMTKVCGVGGGWRTPSGMTHAQ